MPRIIGAVSRALQRRSAAPTTHFHQSAHGAAMPAVCDDPRCPYPRLDERDVIIPA